MAEDDRVQGLVAAWKRLAARWDETLGCAELAERLRRDVVGPFTQAGANRIDLWLNQAAALLAWQDLAGKRPKSAAGEEQDLMALRDACRQWRQRLDDEQRSGKPRVFGLLPQGREQQALLAELAAFLERCQETFARLAATQPADAGSDPKSIERKIDQILAALSNSPPARLATFLRPLGDWRARLAPKLAKCEDWRPLLAEVLPEQPSEVIDALLLVRGILESGPDVPPTLAALARDLLPPERLQVELIRRPDQPAEWFDPPVEADVPAPRPERVGLAIRAPQRPWFCFPRGRLQAPPAKPANSQQGSAQEIIQIASEKSTLSALAAQGPALLEFGTADSQGSAEPLARKLLDAFAQVEGLEPAIGDPMLAALRRWCSEHGLGVLPGTWEFGRPVDYQELSPDECDAVVLFRYDVAKSLVCRVRKFGLRRGDAVIRKSAVTVSAGPAPEGFPELEDLAKSPAADAEKALLARLKEWRLAALHDTLEMTAVQFFVDFWGELGEPLRQRDADKAAEFGRRLAHVLHQGFCLFAFSPAAYQDYPDGWLHRVPGRQMVSGRVRRVVRPGLQDEHNHLRVPALVEVE
ncbi:MAG: hypothetical protein ACJ8F7_00220 [Gemmataceae bacterium]